MQKQPSRGPEELTEMSPWKHKKDGKKQKYGLLNNIITITRASLASHYTDERQTNY